MSGASSGRTNESDRALLHAAECAVAGESLPATVGGYRRAQLLTYDALCTVWSAWHVASGTAAWIAVLRPRWMHQPAMVRRFLAQESVSAVRTFDVLDAAEVPARVLLEPGTPVRDIFPQQDEPPVALPLRASVFAHGIAGLAALHENGRSLGEPVEDCLTLGAEGPHLVYRASFEPPHNPVDEVRQLSRIVLALAPDAQDPIATLARAWAEGVAPDARDGEILVARAMASHLAWLRHQLVRSRRHHTRGSRVARLSRLLRRLDQVQQPPAGRACLAVQPSGTEVHVWVDGTLLRGGPLEPGGRLPMSVVWSPERGLDPVASRIIVRAWSACQGPEKERAQAIQAELGPTAVPPEVFIRWLKAARRLRSARLLLNAESKVRVVPSLR